MPVDPTHLPPVERLLLLLAISELGTLTPAELRRVADSATFVEHRAGAALAAPGAPAALHVVVRGLVDLRASSGVVERLGSRRVVGSLARVLARHPAPDAVAVTDCSTLRLDVDSVEDLLEEEFGVFLGVLRSLTRALLDRSPIAPGASSSSDERGSRDARGREHDLVDRILLLRETIAFGLARLEVLAELARQAAPITRKAGDALWREAGAEGRFLVLSSGVARCAAEGRSITVRAPVALGLLESIAGLPRRFTARAASDVAGFEVPGSLLIDLIEDHPNLGLDLLRAIARAL